jgi:diguanylate cyclase (GGDEF)-like protein
MTIIPLLLLGVIVSIFVYNRFMKIMYNEVEQELKNSALIVSSTYEYAYPGDYDSVGVEHIAIVKGEKVLNGNNDIIDEVKEKTNSEITVFYGNVRVLTTIVDSNGERIVGSTARKLVVNQVLKEGKSRFYSNSLIDNKHYFSYYMPLVNSDGSVCGMVAVSKRASTINKKIRNGIIPIIVMIFLSMVVVAFVSYRYSNNLIKRIEKIKKFLNKTEEGNFLAKLDDKELRGDDELSQMAKSAISMQKALKRLVEQDALTELSNRRYGEKFLNNTQKQYIESGVPFTVAIADIDFFKKINDNYGHECGDRVLVEISKILKDSMVGKGLVARWGGEEFLFVFDKENCDEAYKSLNDIINRIRAKEIYYENNIVSVTMTCGMTEGNSDAIHTILKRADDKLYSGKQKGRNKVVK